MRHSASRLAQLQNAIQNSNATVGGDYVNQATVAMTVRSVGLFGGGEDPTVKVLGMTDPVQAAAILRDEEERRIRDIRALVITSVNNQPVRVEDVVEGGRLRSDERAGSRESSSATRPAWGRMGHWRWMTGNEPRFRKQIARLSQSATTSPTGARASCCCARTRTPCPR